MVKDPIKLDALSIPRTALAAVLAVVGIAWVVVYDFVVFDHPSRIGWMNDLHKWNWLIGFGLLFIGILLASHHSTPLGRGRGVVVGMLTCFLVGLVWIILYYFTSNSDSFPLWPDLGGYSLAVGIAFMASGFVYATKWE